MKDEIKFSAALAAFGNPGDRFISALQRRQTIYQNCSHWRLKPVCRPLTLSMVGICVNDNVNESMNTSINTTEMLCGARQMYLEVKPFEKGAISSRDPNVLNKARDEIAESHGDYKSDWR